MANSLQVIQTRDLLIYQAPWAAAGNAMPADTVLWGTTWGGDFAEVGYTNGGLEVRIGIDRADVRVDQELDAVYRVATGRDMGMRTTLAQISAANIKLATGAGAITTVAAGGGARGHDDLDIGSTLSEQFYSVGYDVKNPGDSEAFRFLVFKGLPVGSPTIGFSPDNPAGIDFDILATPDTSTTPTRILKIRDVIPAAA
jgi:hypothetical protein